MYEIIWVGWIEGIKNFSVLFTKTKISIPKRQGILSRISNNGVVIVTLDRG